MYGPPGTGKSFFVGTLCERSGAYYMSVEASEVSNPSVFESKYKIAKTIRKLSVMEYIKMEGGLDKALEIIADNIVKVVGDDCKRDRVVTFLRNKIRSEEELVQLCMPADENDCLKADQLKGSFIEAFGGSKNDKAIKDAAVIFETLVRYFPGIPVVMFIDEIDKVGDRTLGSNPVLNAICTAVDGGSERRINAGITFIAATNDLETIDRALLRHGRFETILVKYPDSKQRKTIADVMCKRFSDINIVIREEVSDVISRIPLLSGADIWGLLQNTINKMRVKAKKDEKLTIGKEEILGILEKRECNNYISGEAALQVSGYEKVIDFLRGVSIDEPVLYTLYNYYEDVKRSSVLKHGFSFSNGSINALQDASRIITVSYMVNEGISLRVPDDELAQMLVDEMQYRLLVSGIPTVVTEVFVDRLLHGIVGTTRRKVDGMMNKLSAMGESIILLRNLDSLQTGDYVGEWSGSLLQGIRTLKEKKCTVIGVSTLPFFDTAFGELVVPSVVDNRGYYLLWCALARIDPNIDSIKEIYYKGNENEMYLISDVVNSYRLNKESTPITLSEKKYKDLEKQMRMLKSVSKKQEEKLKKVRG
ncbi:MAG: AAA family ATPase [Candidatus Bilamarchaeaceae archaeon]